MNQANNKPNSFIDTMNSDKPLLNMNCLVGITGGIAAYKIPEVVRRLKALGANVRVVMTQGALAFITPLTLQAVSGEEVSTDLLDPKAEAAMGHIELAKWADLIVIAPATADFIGRLNAGLANDLLTTLCLATPSQIVIVPAMNQQMYASRIVQSNLERLKTEAGILVWGPDSGEQACGDIGMGRMISPAAIVDEVVKIHQSTVKTQHQQDLTGLSIMITAGPTQEAIDPVRYITNYSSGKMGYAIAEAAAARGALVTLVSGPVSLNTPINVKRINVLSAEDMCEAVHQTITEQDVFIGTAAVADFKLSNIASQKIKKKSGENTLTLELVQNPDIIKSVAALNDNRPFVVGFAAETEHVEQHALDKLMRKNLDMICANDVSQSSIGFNSDENAIQIYSKKGSVILHKETKLNIAHQLLTEIKKQLG